MTRTDWLRTISIVTITLMVATSVFVSGVSVAAAKTGSIQNTSVTNTIDRDQDDQYSNFDLTVTADTTLKGWDTFQKGEPYFLVEARGSIDGKERTIKLKRTNKLSNTRNEFPLRLKQSKLQRFDSGNIRITVTLFDNDPGPTKQKVDSKSKTVGYESKQDDQKKLKQAVNRVTGLTSVYKKYHNERLSVSYWEEHQREKVMASMDAMFPTNAQDILTDQFNSTIASYADAGFVADLASVPQVGVPVLASLSASKRASVLRNGNQRNNDYEKFHISMEKLISNTENISSASSESEKKELLRNRRDLLKNAYKKEKKLRANLKESYDDDQRYEPRLITLLYGSDKNSFNLVKADLIKLEQTLSTDYIATRNYTSPNRVKKTLTEVADFNQPTYPEPKITEVSMPDKVNAGEPATIEVTVENQGSDAPYQTVALGFPDSGGSGQIDIVDKGLPGAEYSEVFGTGSEVYEQYGASQIEADYPLVEIGGSWKGGATHTIRVRVTPQKPGEFRMYAKSVAKDGGWNSDPTISQEGENGVVIDQQSELAYEHSINVVSPEPKNQPPIARATISSQAVKSGETVTLNARNSADPDGSRGNLEYSWSISEGPRGADVLLPTGATGTVRLSQPGQYEFEVTVSDGEASTSSTVAAEVTETTTPVTPTTTTTTTQPTTTTTSKTSQPDVFTTTPTTSTTTTTEAAPPDTTTTAETTTTTTSTTTTPPTTTATEARSQNKNTKPRVDRQDYTGDGTEDIRLSNGKTWIQLNGEDLNSRTYISALGRNGTGNLAGPWEFNPTTRSATKMQFQSTESAKVAVNSDDVVGYQVVRRYTLEETPFQVNYTVYLPENATSSIVRTEWTNLGSQEVVLDQKQSHIHDGIMAMKGVELADPVGTYRFHVSGQGTHSFNNVRTWQTFRMSGDNPHISIFGDENAITYGLLNGSTAERHAVTNGRPTRLLDFMTKELSLAPGETGSYTLAIGAHEGGSSSPERAQQQLNNAVAHQDELPSQSGESTATDGPSGTPERENDGETTEENNNNGSENGLIQSIQNLIDRINNLLDEIGELLDQIRGIINDIFG